MTYSKPQISTIGSNTGIQPMGCTWVGVVAAALWVAVGVYGVVAVAYGAVGAVSYQATVTGC